jgi:hypothetical protein
MPQRTISARETKQLSLVGGSNCQYNAEDTNWNFYNLIMPSTHENHCHEAFDNVSATSSSSADSQSTYTNDNYANEGEEEDYDDDEVSISKELGGGNR